MIDVIIREERQKDFEKVNQVVKAAFKNVEQSDHTEHLLVERLRKSQAYIPALSLVAQTSQGEIVGHLLLSKAHIINGSQSFEVLALAPLSVAPAFQRNLIGSKLIEVAHQRAKKLGYAAIVLLGHKDYYPRFGYKKAIDYDIRFPFDVPPEFYMVKELVTNSLNEVHGVVQYAPEFTE